MMRGQGGRDPGVGGSQEQGSSKRGGRTAAGAACAVAALVRVVVWTAGGDRCAPEDERDSVLGGARADEKAKKA